MNHSLMVLNYTLPTGQKVPFIAAKMKMVFRNELARQRSWEVGNTLTTIFYLDFCFPKDENPQFRWNNDGISNWDSKGQPAITGNPNEKLVFKNMDDFVSMMDGKKQTCPTRLTETTVLYILNKNSL